MTEVFLGRRSRNVTAVGKMKAVQFGEVASAEPQNLTIRKGKLTFVRW